MSDNPLIIGRAFNALIFFRSSWSSFLITNISINWARVIKISLFVMIGGALGNVFDRLIYGEVIDFISLHVFDYYWYVFNIADIAIVLGGLTILTDLTRDSFVKK